MADGGLDGQRRSAVIEFAAARPFPLHYRFRERHERRRRALKVYKWVGCRDRFPAGLPLPRVESGPSPYAMRRRARV